MGRKCVSYKSTSTYDVPNVKMYGRNRCYAKKLAHCRKGVWYTASGRKIRTRNKNNLVPFTKFSKL